MANGLLPCAEADREGPTTPDPNAKANKVASAVASTTAVNRFAFAPKSIVICCLPFLRNHGSGSRPRSRATPPDGEEPHDAGSQQQRGGRGRDPERKAAGVGQLLRTGAGVLVLLRVLLERRERPVLGRPASRVLASYGVAVEVELVQVTVRVQDLLRSFPVGEVPAVQTSRLGQGRRGRQRQHDRRGQRQQVQRSPHATSR